MGRGRGVGNKFLKDKNVKKRKTCFDDFSFNNFQNKSATDAFEFSNS